MEFSEGNQAVPTWVVGSVVVLFAASLLVGIFIRGNPVAILSGWLWLFGVGFSLFVVYLFYRLVLAIETIANKL